MSADRREVIRAIGWQVSFRNSSFPDATHEGVRAMRWGNAHVAIHDRPHRRRRRLDQRRKTAKSQSGNQSDRVVIPNQCQFCKLVLFDMESTELARAQSTEIFGLFVNPRRAGKRLQPRASRVVAAKRRRERIVGRWPCPATGGGARDIGRDGALEVFSPASQTSLRPGSRNSPLMRCVDLCRFVRSKNLLLSPSFGMSTISSLDGSTEAFGSAASALLGWED